MKIFKNRLIIGIICIIAAILIGFVGVPLLSYTASKTVKVIVANEDIPIGTKIEKSMLSEIDMSKKGMSEKVYNDINNVVGCYAKENIVKEEIILSSKVTEDIPFEDPNLYNLPENSYAITVSVKSLAASVGGKIKEGDVVTVFVNLKNEDGETSDKAKMYDELMYVEIIGITNEMGIDTKEISSEDEANIPASVTLKVNVIQAQLLAGFEENSDVHLALAARKYSDKAKKLLDLQQSYFTRNYSEEQWFNIKTSE